MKPRSRDTGANPFVRSTQSGSGYPPVRRAVEDHTRLKLSGMQYKTLKACLSNFQLVGRDSQRNDPSCSVAFAFALAVVPAPSTMLIRSPGTASKESCHRSRDFARDGKGTKGSMTRIRSGLCRSQASLGCPFEQPKQVTAKS